VLRSGSSASIPAPAPGAQHLQKKIAANFPQINHSRKNEISSARIVWRSIFFVLVSHTATRKTDCTNAGARRGGLLIAAIVRVCNLKIFS
jgi:hypothetical protein